MAWKTVQYKLQSSAPMLMHNGQTADPLNKFSKAIKQISSKRKKTDADLEEMAHLEFLAGLYIGEDGPIVPAYVIDALVINAAKKLRDGPTAKSGCFCNGPAKLEYDGPRDAEKLWEDEDFHFSAIVRVQSARISRMRPIFNDWSCVITLNYEDTLLNVSRLDDWMHIAGTQVGVGDWRPQYGRFTVERLNGK